MARHNQKSLIPDRWLDYSAVGQRLKGTRFIAFKVPLNQSLNCRLQRSEAFGFRELLDAVSRQDLNQDLGLVIDLTNTTRYYSIEDVPESLCVVKIFTAGHAIPNDATILSFKRVVRRFLRDNADNERLIGVHCTHGLNRTGYLICRYLIDVDGMDPEEALQLFNRSRGHALERQNYLDDLRLGPRRSNRGMEESGPQPRRGEAPQRRERNRETRGGGAHPAYWEHRSSQSSDRRHHHTSSLPRASPYYRPPAPPPHYRPPAPPPPRPPPHPYRWGAPHPAEDWSSRRNPPWEEESRPRHSQAPPPPLPPSFLPHSSLRWRRDGYDRRDEDRRHPRHRANGHDGY